MPGKLLTWDPDKKRGVSLNQEEYDLVKEFIIQNLKGSKQVALIELLHKAKELLTQELGDETGWFIINVKRDLEARGLIRKSIQGPERLQMLSLVRGSRRRKSGVT